MSEISIVRLASSEIPKAAHVLGEAFERDPFVTKMFPDAQNRARYFAKTTKLVLHYAVARGEVYVASPGIQGVAVWLPPSHVTPTNWDMLRFGMWRLPFSVGMQSLKLILSYIDHTAEMRKRHIHGPHWFLQLLGVAPSARGTGCSSRLLRHMLERLDREGLPCCLDTENEVNVAIYEHFGFKVKEQSDIPGGGTCWLMAREPGATPKRRVLA